MTHCEALLGMLERGGWVTCAEILREHPMIVHSRVAELRKRGHAVEHETTGKGAAGSRYRLAPLETGATVPPMGGHSPGGGIDGAGAPVSSGDGSGIVPASFVAGVQGQDAAPNTPKSVSPGIAGRPVAAVPPDVPGQLSLTHG